MPAIFVIAKKQTVSFQITHDILRNKPSPSVIASDQRERGNPATRSVYIARQTKTK
jgi:hypothetical protein